jgi:hypothetical protein
MPAGRYRLAIEIVHQQRRQTADETRDRRNKKFYIVGVSFIEPLPHGLIQYSRDLADRPTAGSVTSARGKLRFACQIRAD